MKKEEIKSVVYKTDSGSKLEKAKLAGVSIISEQDLYNFIHYFLI